MPAVEFVNGRTRAARWVSTCIAVGGAALLVAGWFAARPLWVDEEMLLLNVRDRTFANLGGALWLDQTAPLGWLALERLVYLTFGTDERVLRLLPLLFAISTLFVCVWVGRRWMSPLGAAVLVLLCSTGSWIVFFSLELKHYSSDTFWALLVPAVAAWAVDTDGPPGALRRRVAIWWTVAAAGLWLSNGAVFVSPACAAILFVAGWRRGGRRLVSWTAAAGVIWLASFGLSYLLVLRHALGNSYLQEYWAFAFPPAAGGVWETLAWVAGQPEPFAVKPIGSERWILVWCAAASGVAYAIATRRPLGWFVAAVPASACALALLRVVPPFERLALWVVPSMYVAIGLCADAAVWLVQRRHERGRAIALVPAAAALFAAGSVTLDVVQRGRAEFLARPPSNYGLDDRRSIQLLTKLQRPGDAVATTHFGLAGLWWYGRVDISGPDPAGTQFRDGSRIFELGYSAPGPECDQRQRELDEALRGHRRLIVYLGFRLNVLPDRYDRLVMAELGRRFALVGYREYAEESVVAAFDLERAPSGDGGLPGRFGAAPREPRPSDGCVTIAAARRW